jgi:hypothetical protein
MTKNISMRTAYCLVVYRVGAPGNIHTQDYKTRAKAKADWIWLHNTFGREAQITMALTRHVKGQPIHFLKLKEGEGE